MMINAQAALNRYFPRRSYSSLEERNPDMYFRDVEEGRIRVDRNQLIQRNMPFQNIEFYVYCGLSTITMLSAVSFAAEAMSLSRGFSTDPRMTAVMYAAASIFTVCSFHLAYMASRLQEGS